ncbi:MAG: CRTAC1 family protein [Acidobacteriota bacterium]|nr:CRTAC1 family protein [Acidobacteriota bacterium]
MTSFKACVLSLLILSLAFGSGAHAAGLGGADLGGGGLSFTDVSAAAGLDYQHGYSNPDLFEAQMIAGGVAAGDYDGDGWMDLYIVRGDIGPNLLYRNRGDGTFEERAAAAGVGHFGDQGSGPTFADVDGDGWLDLVIGGVRGTAIRLYRNRGDGTFENITAASGLFSHRDTFSAAFGDYDRDGDLDIFFTHWGFSGDTEHLWRNDGGGQFTDVGQGLGIGPSYIDRDNSFTPNFTDIDGDGWPDLLIAGDFGTSKIFHNQAGTGFVETTTDVISDENGMGAAIGDYDNDGDLDWFVSSIWDPTGDPVGNWGVTGNRLYRNRGDGTYEDATTEAGVREGYWGWGSCFADLNNDGWLDLFHVNGMNFEWVDFYYSDPSRLFMNRGDGTFEERSADLGIEDHLLGRGVVCFDYDQDGDIDLFVANNSGPPRLFRNDGGNDLNSTQIRLQGTDGNTEGIGAWIWVTAGGLTQVRELRAGSHFVSQSPAVAHFGLGAATQLDEVRVRWPDGTEEVARNLPVRPFLTLVQGQVEGVAPDIPTLSPLALLCLALFLFAAGAWLLRRRTRESMRIALMVGLCLFVAGSAAPGWAAEASAEAAKPLAQYVIMAHSPIAGKTVPLARAVVAQGEACPTVQVGKGGESRAMTERANPNPAAFGVTVCEAVLASAAGEAFTEASIAGQALPLPPADGQLQKIAVVGDSGCKGGDKQPCSGDGATWPFAAVASAAAESEPDLVIHVGDFNYRGTPNKTEQGNYSYDGCIPPGNPTLVHQSSYSTWSTWDEDLFTAAAPLLAAAPWVMVRGNHELCSRGGQGWFYFLDPHSTLLDPYRHIPGCDAPTAPTDPYRLSFANLDLLVVDTANACGTGEGSVGARGEGYEVDFYALQLDSLEQLLRGSQKPAWLLGHRPLWSVEEFGSDQPTVDNPTLQAALKATRGGALPGQVQLVLSGHMHQFFSMTFDGPRPPQLVIGNSGVVLDGNQMPSPFDDVTVDGLQAQGLSVASGANYGYLGVEMIHGARWQGTVYAFDAAGNPQDQPVATCAQPVQDGRLCQPGT